jgi:hypothetical protein
MHGTTNVKLVKIICEFTNITNVNLQYTVFLYIVSINFTKCRFYCKNPFPLSMKTENYKMNKNGDVPAYTRNTVARSR